AGKGLLEECRVLGGCDTGDAKITKGYNLPCKYVIHTVGPVYRDGSHGEETLLRSCYRNSLQLALEYGCESVAFPLISSGAYGYPKDQVLKFAIQVISEFLFEHELTVYICVYDRSSYDFSKKLFSEISEIINDDDVEDDDIEGYGNNRFEDCEIFDSEPFFDKPALRECIPTPNMAAPYSSESCSAKGKTLKEYMETMDKTFAYKLFDLIDERGMTDVECYKKANVDKKTFSKIKCNPKTYKPSKQTAVAFAIALRLNLEETQDLLASAGLTLSRSFVFDKIIRYFIQKEVYDIFEINEALFEFDQVLLGV
ncbi:MAG: macro domain-containing protein, partial [Clostridia bacterium]|nr:macro domain-containing protein [Clostridia bacterium]